MMLDTSAAARQEPGDCQDTNLLGASIRIGALIPRYSLEKLAVVSLQFPRPQVTYSLPLILDDLPEAVYHAIVAIFSYRLAGLKLSANI